jgi:hypothetical protein
MLRSGFLLFFFLVPIGFVVFGYKPKSGVFTAVLASLGNGFLGLGLAFQSGRWGDAVWDALFFTLICFSFIWVIAPVPREKLPSWISPLGLLGGAYRLIGASCISALLLLGVLYRFQGDPGFVNFLKNQAEQLFSLNKPGPDVVQNALMETLTPEFLMDLVTNMVLKGGGLVSSVLLFYFSRQMSLALSKVFRRRSPQGGALFLFHVPARLIWFFSFALFFLLLSRVGKVEAAEILFLNILIICVILYLAQGLGIIQYFMVRSVPPLQRFALNMMLFVLLFSPGLNAVVLGILLILGVAENWVSFRSSPLGEAPENKGPPSTPGA